MPKLRKFWCYGNKFRDLPNDLTARFPNLELLWCGANSLTELPGMELLNLRELNCENNQLRDLSQVRMNVPSLTRFICSGNKLANLPGDMINWMKLEYLDYSSNFGPVPLVLSDTQKIFLFDKQVQIKY